MKCPTKNDLNYALFNQWTFYLFKNYLLQTCWMGEIIYGCFKILFMKYWPHKVIKIFSISREIFVEWLQVCLCYWLWRQKYWLILFFIMQKILFHHHLCILVQHKSWFWIFKIIDFFGFWPARLCFCNSVQRREQFVKL